MTGLTDPREIQAIMSALDTISKFLGKETEFLYFRQYTDYAEKSMINPSIEEIASKTPYWVRAISPALIGVYEKAYRHGYYDGKNDFFHKPFRPAGFEDIRS